MYKTTVTSQGTISIPAPLRKKYKLQTGQQLIIEDTGKIVISKTPNFSEIRKMNQAEIKEFKPYSSGDGFKTYVTEKYDKE